MFGWFNQLFGEMPQPQAPRLWLHFACTSVLTTVTLAAYLWSSLAGA